MVPDAWRQFLGFNLQLASIPRVAHQRESVREKACHTVFEGKEVHDLGRHATWGVKVLVNLEPHHDAKVYVFTAYTRAHDWDFDSLVHAEL